MVSIVFSMAKRNFCAATSQKHILPLDFCKSDTVD